jgi:hypothetical protein
VFVNGVYNSQVDARASCDALSKQLVSGGITSPRVLLFYNRTQQAAWRDCEAAARIADDTRRRTGVVSPSRPVVRPSIGTALVMGAGPEPISIPEDALRLGCYQPDDLVEAASQYTNIIGGFKQSSQPDALALGAALDQLLIDPQRRVAVVSHSQGNLLFQEAVFGRGTPIDAKKRLRIGWISVSAPYLESSPALGGFTSVVLPGDPIRALRNAAEPTQAEGWRRFTQSSQHFFATYLAADETRSAIIEGVRTFLGGSPTTAVASANGVCGVSAPAPRVGATTSADALRQSLCVTFEGLDLPQKTYRLAARKLTKFTPTDGSATLMLSMHGNAQSDGELLPAALTLARSVGADWKVLFSFAEPPGPPESDNFATMVDSFLAASGSRTVLVATMHGGSEPDYTSTVRVIEPSGSMSMARLFDVNTSPVDLLYPLGLPKALPNDQVILRGIHGPTLELRVALLRSNEQGLCPAGGEYAFLLRLDTTPSGYRMMPMRYAGRRACAAR